MIDMEFVSWDSITLMLRNLKGKINIEVERHTTINTAMRKMKVYHMSLLMHTNCLKIFGRKSIKH